MLFVAVALAVTTCYLHPAYPAGGDFGLCLPSPNRWNLLPVWNGIINGVLLVSYSLWIWFFNKRYNFVKSTDYTLPSLFILFTATNPLCIERLSTSTLLLGFWLLTFSVLFGCYRQRNATQELFLVATFLAIGSMFDYSFLVCAPMVIIAAIMLKAMGIKELMAFIMGLVAPYWIALGFGWLTPADFHIPQFSNYLNGPLLPAEVLTMGVGLGLLWICAAICALNTVVKLYAGNPKPRTFNYIIYLAGIYLPLCIIADSGHLSAYLDTLYFCIAVMVANFLTLFNVTRPALWVWIIAGLSIAYWVMLAF